MWGYIGNYVDEVDDMTAHLYEEGEYNYIIVMTVAVYINTLFARDIKKLVKEKEFIYIKSYTYAPEG